MCSTVEYTHTCVNRVTFHSLAMSMTSTVEYTHTCVIVFIVLLFIVLQCQRRQLSSILTLVLLCLSCYFS